MLVRDKEVVRDSGIEASGEAEQVSVRELSPSTLGPVSQEKEAVGSTEVVKSEESLPDEKPVPHQNGIIPEADTANIPSEASKLLNGIVEIVDAYIEVLEHGDEDREYIEVLECGDENGDEEEEEDGEDEEVSRKRWSFPPILDEFDLMATDKDPAELEDIFSDERLKEIKLRIEVGGPSLGITIVGGSNSPNGDLPMLIKRVIPGSLADQEGSIKTGDELVAVNETLLAGVDKDYAARALSKLEGDIRLLVLQDY